MEQKRPADIFQELLDYLWNGLGLEEMGWKRLKKGDFKKKTKNGLTYQIWFERSRYNYIDYLWMQCNDFPSACSIMISIAHIPFCGSSFRGCICAIVYQGREYRLATYRGVKVQAFTPEHICLSQGSLLLELDITSPHTGHPLRAPQCGKMSSTIRESCNVHLQARLWERGKAIFSLQSDHAAYEFVPNHGT